MSFLTSVAHSLNIAVPLRWLSNEQAAADSANFIDNVTFPGFPADLTAPGTPWIYYGVSPPSSSLLSYAVVWKSIFAHMAHIPSIAPVSSILVL